MGSRRYSKTSRMTSSRPPFSHETGRYWPQRKPHDGASAANSGLSHSQSGMNGLTRSHSQDASTLPPIADSYRMPTPPPEYPGSQDSHSQYPNETAHYSASDVPGAGVSSMPPMKTRMHLVDIRINDLRDRIILTPRFLRDLVRAPAKTRA
jgi:hypothetical protein